MTDRQLDNIRIATKALIYFVVPLGLYLVLFILGLFLFPVRQDDGIYPYEPSYGELVISFIVLLPLILAFILPLLVIKREFDNRKNSESGTSLLN